MEKKSPGQFYLWQEKLCIAGFKAKTPLLPVSLPTNVDYWTVGYPAM